MGKRRISQHVSWKHFKENVAELTIEALLILRSKTDLVKDEKALNRTLHKCFVEANHRLKLNYMPSLDAKNAPYVDGTKREDNIPDLSWNIIDHSADPEHCNRNFVLECKRLGLTGTSHTLNREYVEEGIHRFILEEKGYGKGSESGAMVAYIENMEFEDILRQVNEYIAIRSLSSILPSSATGWQRQGVTRFNHVLVRSFTPSIFSLEHFWLDLRDCQMLPMQHRKPSDDKGSIEPSGQEVIQLELDLTETPKAD